MNVSILAGLILLSCSSCYKFINDPLSTLIFGLPHEKFGLLIDCDFSPSFERVTWQKKTYNGWSDMFLGSSFQVLPNNTLRIIDLDETDESHEFRCVGQVSLWGTVVRPPVRVLIASPPTLVDGPSSVISVEGGLAKLICNASGIPEPEISWAKDGKVLKASRSKYYFIPAAYGLPAALEIQSLDSSDAGVFSCTASNALGDVTSSMTELEVNKGPSTISFYGIAQNITAYSGENILLQCAARGNGLRYTWRLNEATLQETDFERMSDGNIILHSLSRRKHSGIYQCLASSQSFNQAQSHNPFHLEVVQKPEIADNSYPAVVMVKQNERNRIVLPCRVSGYPEPVVRWFHDAKPIEMDRIYFDRDDDGTLIIEGLLSDDSGIYQCMASSSVGTASKYYHLVVEEVKYSTSRLGAPEIVNTVTTSPTSVDITWEEVPEGGTITGYVVTYWEAEANLPRKKQLNTMANSRSISIRNLRENTKYTFEVRANSTGNLGSPSTRNLRTSRSTQTDSSIIVSHSNVQSSSVIISWVVNTFAYDQFTVKYVAVGFSPTDADPDGTQDPGLPIPQQETTQQSTLVLSNLQEDCKYNVTVSSSNSYGITALGTDTFVTHAAEPDEPPRNVHVMALDPDKIEVRWDPPLKRAHNGIITSFLIKFRPKKLRDQVNTHPVDDPEVRQVVLSDKIEGGTAYQICVAAVNGEGAGPFSDWQEVTTLLMPLEEDQVPGKVVGLTSVDVQSTSITIAWTGTENDSVQRVREYHIYVYKLAIPNNDYIAVPATVNQYTITNIQPGLMYLIEVAGVNKVGEGIKAQKSITSPPSATSIDPPLQVPNNVSVRTVDSDTLRVSFSPNNPPKIDISYRVEVSSRFPTRGSIMKECNSNTDCLVSGLRAGTEYEVKVQAVRRHGDQLIESFWSMSTTCFTDEAVPSSPPSDLTANAVPGIPTNLILSWIGPSEPNGEITGYDLSYTTDVNDREWALDHINMNMLAYEVKDLTLQTTYYFKIAARNSKGIGPASEILSYTTPAPVFTGDGSGGARGTEEAPGLSKEYVIIIIVAVGAVTILIICLIAAFVVCRVFGNKQSAASVKSMGGASRPQSQMTTSVYGTNAKQLMQMQPQQLPDVAAGGGLLWEHRDFDMYPQGDYNVDHLRSKSPPDIHRNLTMTTHLNNPSPTGMPNQMLRSSPHANYECHNDVQQQPQPIRPTPMRGADMPLQQHPLSSSGVPTMAIKPMLMQTHAQSHTPPMMYNGQQFKPNPQGFHGGEFPRSDSSNQVYSPGSSVSGVSGHSDHSNSSYHRSSIGRGGDKALKPLPQAPPELKPLALSTTRSQPPLLSMQNSMPLTSGALQYSQANTPNTRLKQLNKLPSTTSSGGSSSPINAVSKPWGMTPPGLDPNSMYNDEQEVGAEVDKLEGLMSRLNASSSQAQRNSIGSLRLRGVGGDAANC